MKLQESNKHKTGTQRSKLIIVDGTSLCYRSYYAIRQLSSSQGEPTNAIYGFTVSLKKLIQDQKPEYLAICFDRREPTFRHERYKEYKAHRKPMPEDLGEQMEPIKDVCRAFRFAVFEKPGYEADDLIGTLAHRADQEGRFDVYIMTGDKDALQLVSEHVRVINPHKDDVVIGIEEVKKRFDGLGPEKVVEVMALMGDSSDNIPGIPGIGEKTAVKLIREFGSVETMLKHAGRIKSKSQRELVQSNEASARMSLELATIEKAAPLNLEWDQLKVGEPDIEKLTSIYKRYEFRGLLKEVMPPTSSAGMESVTAHYQTIRSLPELEKLAAVLSKAEAISFDTETTSSDPMRAELVGMSFSWREGEAAYVPVRSPEQGELGLTRESVFKVLKPVLEDANKKKYGQNAKYDWIVMRRQGVEVRGILFDTMIASYLINPVKLNHNLDDISLEYLGIKKIETVSLLGSGKNQVTMDQVPLERVAAYACEDADCVFRLAPILKAKLEAHGLFQLFEKVELPLAFVLGKMEMNGVCLDTKFLSELSAQAGKDLDRLTAQIYEEAGGEFNINSTKQLAEILFTKLKLPVIRRTKTGYSTDVSVLEKLALTHEMPKKLLEYREKQKLKSTYLDALPEMINPGTGLVHTSYHQTTTATGRLSSSDPNLQNIPIRTEAGRLIRKAFIARPEKGVRRVIFSADYSQIELRILAHLSLDENLTAAFREDRDIHKFTATLLYGVKEADVTRDMRNLAKVINFSIIYGKTAFGLSQDLNLSVGEAEGFIENYFKRYKAVKDYLEAQKDKARKQGYLTTILGRRAYFPEINSKNGQIRQFAERAAINAPIQGSSADLIKLAMIRIQNRLEKESQESLMTMQVHDELVFDVPETGEAEVKKIVKHEMESAFELRIPLRVDMFVGTTWFKG